MATSKIFIMNVPCFVSHPNDRAPSRLRVYTEQRIALSLKTLENDLFSFIQTKYMAHTICCCDAIFYGEQRQQLFHFNNATLNSFLGKQEEAPSWNKLIG